MNAARHESTASADMLGSFGKLPHRFPHVTAIHLPATDGLNAKLVVHEDDVPVSPTATQVRSTEPIDTSSATRRASARARAIECGTRRHSATARAMDPKRKTGSTETLFRSLASTTSLPSHDLQAARMRRRCCTQRDDRSDRRTRVQSGRALRRRGRWRRGCWPGWRLHAPDGLPPPRSRRSASASARRPS